MHLILSVPVPLHFFEDKELGDCAVPRRGENGRSPRRAQPRAAPGPRCCRSPPGEPARHTACAFSSEFSICNSLWSVSFRFLFFASEQLRGVLLFAFPRTFSPVLPQRASVMLIVGSCSFSVTRGVFRVAAARLSASFALRSVLYSTVADLRRIRVAPFSYC